MEHRNKETTQITPEDLEWNSELAAMRLAIEAAFSSAIETLENEDGSVRDDAGERIREVWDRFYGWCRKSGWLVGGRKLLEELNHLRKEVKRLSELPKETKSRNQSLKDLRQNAEVARYKALDEKDEALSIARNLPAVAGSLLRRAEEAERERDEAQTEIGRLWKNLADETESTEKLRIDLIKAEAKVETLKKALRQVERLHTVTEQGECLICHYVEGHDSDCQVGQAMSI